MTKRRPFPDSAIYARDQAAEGVQAIIRLVRPLIEHDDRIVIARAGKILDHAQNALRHLEVVGAPTQPDDVDHVGGGLSRHE